MFSIVLLSMIQGIAEFLPISSSAHLIIFRDIFLVGREVITNDISIIFDLALHFGTLLSILIYFCNDLFNIAKNKKLLLYIIVATIPGAFFGLLFEDIIENIVRSNYYLIILSLSIMGIIIYYVDKKRKQNRSLDDITLKDSIIIGLFQVLALIPGFSRSGSTIVAARYLNINRTDASKYSFYLSIPIVMGAFFLKLIKTDIKIITMNLDILITGIIISFIIGLLCIRLLLGYVKSNDFKIFMWYRIALSIIVFLFLFL